MITDDRLKELANQDVYIKVMHDPIFAFETERRPKGFHGQLGSFTETTVTFFESSSPMAEDDYELRTFQREDIISLVPYGAFKPAVVKLPKKQAI